MGLLLVVAALIAGALQLQRKFSNDQVFLVLHKCCTYILAFFLLKYGFDKLFHFQFYPPEPNTLFTPIGSLTKDILFWSTMGSSNSYNTFMGLIEVLPGFMLLWKRTRLLAALIGLGVLINVFALNIGFDITVKLLSLYLVLLTLFVLIPWAHVLINIYFQNGENEGENNQLDLEIKPFTKRVLKGGIVLLFILELITPYADAGSFSGVDYSKIPYFGSYELANPEIGFMGDTTLRRIHIHSKGYLITESINETFTDYPIRTSSLDKKIFFKDLELILSIKHLKNHITFSWSDMGEIKRLLVQKIDLDKLPLRNDSTHWTVDGLMNSSKE